MGEKKIEEKEEKEEEEGAGVIRITADAFNHLQAAELGQSQAESAPVVTELFLDPSRTSLLDSNLSQTRPKPGVYPRAGATKTECGKIRSAIPGGARIQKQFDTMLADLGFSMENGRWPLEMPTAAVCANFIALQVGFGVPLLHPTSWPVADAV